ncbi:MAG: hypothetical protein HUJ29_07530, partial [Gammaproteobacteria bacterium]|nr:hypothetical protein [Gammaproteobacteria bacterium]
PVAEPFEPVEQQETVIGEAMPDESAAEVDETVEDEEEFLSDEDLKAIDALNLALRDNIHGRTDAAPESEEEAELAQEERELESDLAGDAQSPEEQGRQS